MRNFAFFLPVCALALSAQPALAQDRHIEAVNHSIQTPPGASATLGVRIPLGVERERETSPVFGLTVAYGVPMESSHPSQQIRTRKVELAQLNFDTRGARDLQVANFSLAQFGRDDIGKQRANLSTGETLLVVGGVAAAAVLIVFVAADDEDFNFFEE